MPDDRHETATMADTTEADEKVVALEAELSAMRAERKTERVEQVVTLLAAKGCTEPTIAGFRALMTADDMSIIMLSDEEGAEPVDVVDAVEAIAETLSTTVPVEAEGEQPNEAAAADADADATELTDSDRKVARMLDISDEDMLAATLTAREVS